MVRHSMYKIMSIGTCLWQINNHLCHWHNDPKYHKSLCIVNDFYHPSNTGYQLHFIDPRLDSLKFLF